MNEGLAGVLPAINPKEDDGVKQKAAYNTGASKKELIFLTRSYVEWITSVKRLESHDKRLGSNNLRNCC